jgi:hypothetical protein
VSPLIDTPAEQRGHYRRNLLIVSGGLAVLALAWWGFKVWLHSPQVPLASNLAVFALFNLNLIVFLLLVVLLFRNLVKPPSSGGRRSWAPGSRPSWSSPSCRWR